MDSSSLVQFHGVNSIADFVNTAVIGELLKSERVSCSIFLNQIQTYCKLKQHLDLLHSIFFMEAGHHMHQFSVELFDKLDSGSRVDNLVLLNGHFHECIEGIAKRHFTPADLQHKFSVEFAENPQLYHIDATNSLDYLVIDFRADWPLEIIFDKQSLVNYNAVFRFLMRIKRVNYMI